MYIKYNNTYIGIIVYYLWNLHNWEKTMTYFLTFSWHWALASFSYNIKICVALQKNKIYSYTDPYIYVAYCKGSIKKGKRRKNSYRITKKTCFSLKLILYILILCLRTCFRTSGERTAYGSQRIMFLALLGSMCGCNHLTLDVLD